MERLFRKKISQEGRIYEKPTPDELNQIIHDIEEKKIVWDLPLPLDWESYLKTDYFKNWRQSIHSFKNFEEIELYESALKVLRLFIPLMIKDPRHFKKEYLKKFEKELASVKIEVSDLSLETIFSISSEQIRARTDWIIEKIRKIKHYSEPRETLGIVLDWESYLTSDYFKNWCDKIASINPWNGNSGELNLFFYKLGELINFIGGKVKNEYDKKTANFSIREKEEELAKIKTKEEMDSRRLLFLRWDRFCPTCNKDVLFRNSSLKEQRQRDYQLKSHAWCNDCGTDIGTNQSMKVCLKCLAENNWNNENCHRVYVKGDWGEKNFSCPIHGKVNGEILSLNQQEELAKARKRIVELQKAQVNNQQKSANWIPWIIGSSVLVLLLIISFLAIRKIKKKQKRN